MRLRVSMVRFLCAGEQPPVSHPRGIAVDSKFGVAAPNEAGRSLARLQWLFVGVRATR